MDISIECSSSVPHRIPWNAKRAFNLNLLPQGSGGERFATSNAL
jgi:hypothetical protein